METKSLTVEQAAAVLGTNPRNVYRVIEEDLPEAGRPARFGRAYVIGPQDLERIRACLHARQERNPTLRRGDGQ